MFNAFFPVRSVNFRFTFCPLYLFFYFMICSPPLWAIRLVIKDQLMQDLFYIENFSVRSKKIALIYSQGGTVASEHSLECKNEEEDLECSFWSLLQKIIADRKLPEDLILNDVNLFGERLKLARLEKVIKRNMTVIWLQLFPSSQGEWVIRAVVRSTRRSMIQQDLSRVEIYYNNQLYYVVLPGNNSELINGTLKGNVRLVKHPACRYSGLAEESMTAFPPPPQPPGAGTSKLLKGHPLNIVHYRDFVTGQVLSTGAAQLFSQ